MSKRILISFAVLLVCFAGMVARIGFLVSGDAYTAAAAAQSSRSLFVTSSRGAIYDCNLKPLVNRSSRTLLAVNPTAQSLAELKTALSPQDFAAAIAILESGAPAVLAAECAVNSEDIISFSAPVRTDKSQQAEHIIGYANEQGGVVGIEAGYETLLAETYGGTVGVRYTVNALGGAVGGQAQVSDTRSEKGGLVLTLDRDIQSIAEEAAQTLERGAVVVMRVKNGEVAAICSRPGFDVTDVAASLNDTAAPLFNRATAAYNVGSAFKICLAAAALESGIMPDFSYECGGYYQLGALRFYCHDRAGHGVLDMHGAIGQSCNPYFIALGQRVGALRLIDMAEKMGFGSAVKLAEGIIAAAGNLPQLSGMSRGELANLSFGQGELTATPVQLCRMMAIVANGGLAVQPTLLRGETTDGSTVLPLNETPEPVRILSESTAKTLQKMLTGVVEEGTGKNAGTQYCTAGGKTSSAQTGVYENGEEIVHAWFVGFFPADMPRYAVAVFSEGGGAGGQVPARAFAQIAEKVTLLEHPQIVRDR